MNIRWLQFVQFYTLQMHSSKSASILMNIFCVEFNMWKTDYIWANSNQWFRRYRQKVVPDRFFENISRTKTDREFGAKAKGYSKCYGGQYGIGWGVPTHHPEGPFLEFWALTDFHFFGFFFCIWGIRNVLECCFSILDTSLMGPLLPSSRT